MDRHLFLAALVSLAGASFACAGSNGTPTERTNASAPLSADTAGGTVASSDPAETGASTGTGTATPAGSTGAVAAGGPAAGGSTDTTGGSAGTTPPAPGATGGTGGSTGTTTPPATGTFRGDGKLMFAFGGWAWGNDPAAAIASAGFDWFETGYSGDAATNATLLTANVRPFAYINLGELDPSLAAQAHYTGPVLRTNSDWGTQLVDVTDASWQAWIVSRADYSWQTGSRGVKWDVASPDVPPGKTRADVNEAIATMMRAIRAMHPDMKFIYNQGFEFVLAHPELTDALETEGMMSASSYPAAFCDPAKDPFYWGPQYQQAVAVQALGIPVIVAEYFDPASTQAQQVYACTVAQDFIPYTTNADWNIRGWGYGVPAGW